MLGLKVQQRLHTNNSMILHAECGSLWTVLPNIFLFKPYTSYEHILFLHKTTTTDPKKAPVEEYPSSQALASTSEWQKTNYQLPPYYILYIL